MNSIEEELKKYDTAWSALPEPPTPTEIKRLYAEAWKRVAKLPLEEGVRFARELTDGINAALANPYCGCAPTGECDHDNRVM